MTEATTTEQTPGSQNPEAGKTETTPTSEAKTFTQDEVNQMVKDRLDRERKKYTDYDDLKAKAKKLKEIEDSQLTEQQQREVRQKELETENASLKAERDGFKAKELRFDLFSKASYNEQPLPMNLFKYVQGNSEEEIQASIESVKVDFLKAKPKESKSVSGGSQTQPPPKQEEKDLAAQIGDIDKQLADPKIQGNQRQALFDKKYSLMVQAGRIKIR